VAYIFGPPCIPLYSTRNKSATAHRCLLKRGGGERGVLRALVYDCIMKYRVDNSCTFYAVVELQEESLQFTGRT